MISVSISPDTDMEFCPIPPGTFRIGSPDTEPGRYPDEGPQHEVTLSSGFYLARTPVTQHQWAALMGSRPWD
ncbi:MAG: SUMF1/EgtB/PvdO family nonheme iron enzyme [candidate division Zixibacteria bacterium]|nr:SUMF1/EgtB/PvdO family nonheme iron enzyme [candidate division Zixibacteria bacterium]